MDLKNKVVLITGAGKGAGRALALALAQRGVRVAVNDISPINVEEAAAEITTNGGEAKAYVEDIAKKVGVQYLVKGVEDDFGAIDILINHASVEPHTPLLKMDEWDWHRTLDVNLTGVFLTLQSAGRMMRDQGHGAIINIVAGSGEGSIKDAGAYLSSKAGAGMLSCQADVELSPFGVRVYAVENSTDVVKDVLSILEAQ